MELRADNSGAEDFIFFGFLFYLYFLMQELAKQFINTMKQNTVSDYEKFTIVSFLPREEGAISDTPSFQPHSIKRDIDEEIFSIGDTVTNGTKMIGKILSFEMLNDKVFVNHTWSGIGMNLGSLKKVNQLPAQHQIGDKVKFSINQQDENKELHEYNATAKVIGVHFYNSKVKYDLEIPISDEAPTRVYNIDSCFVTI